MTTNPPITLRSPTKYTPSTTTSSTSPPFEWLNRTWSVTHSTLSMWRSARNVRITYTPLEPTKTSLPRVDDLVEYEHLSGNGSVKSVAGIDTAAAAGNSSVWSWRGKGWLFFVTSHWEILGWGERTRPDGEVERWLVSWFAATTFTKEGLDILTDRKEGVGEETAGEILQALKGLEAKRVVELVEKDMLPVKVSLPWKES
ncbi:hypothetical protein B0H67DRAFT_603837 [Lasiosphaeris hirsuta]|uniref:Uncharacterized protein n=1 Tax=Lasiosphaeris hirsuta TaxID=260670 RepID=A0AA40DIH4_9PEZI|nr:hypothetical protein B0H67DRAFT_603837 [Lasiosphaeris hirsuta]